ncbi:MAG: alpha/beta hydrolase [Deltaproteobacteria bacterium]|nr:alpha/beta hydrolase [Deltaproteobacteria bacterium]
MLPEKPDDRYVHAGPVLTRYWALGSTGSPVILIHGLGASADIWIKNIKILAQRHRVYVPDVVGFGLSEKPEELRSPYYFSQFINDFMVSIEIERASLVGHSLGGGIALQYAIRYPDKVEKLVVADGAGLGREVIYTLKLMSLPIIGELMSYPTRFGVSMFFKLAVRNHGIITADIIDTYYELFQLPGARRSLLQIVRSIVTLRGGRENVFHPVLANLHTISAPTLIIWGRQDRVLPLKHAYIAREHIPNASLRIIENCGHITNLECPDEFNDVVMRFLDNETDMVA